MLITLVKELETRGEKVELLSGVYGRYITRQLGLIRFLLTALGAPAAGEKVLSMKRKMIGQVLSPLVKPGPVLHCVTPSGLPSHLLVLGTRF